jgi:hypothetical protein
MRSMHGLREPLFIRIDRIGSLGRTYYYGDQEVSRDEMLLLVRVLRSIQG